MALSLSVALALPARAEEPSREYLVKAAFIFYFTQFVQWPDSAFQGPDDVFIVALVGDDPFNGALERALAGKTVGSHRVVSRHFDNAAAIGACQILFVPSAEDREFASIAGKLGNKPVLTVGETEGFPGMGGDVSFFAEGKKIRFEINIEAMNEGGLKVSAKLAKLARIFHPS